MKAKGHSKKIASSQKRYVTKRVLKTAVAKAVRKASSNAMSSMGYVIKAENGWVIREDSSGTKRKIKKIPSARQSRIVLD